MRVICIIDSSDLYGKERANIQVARVLKDNGYDVKLLINTLATPSIREEVKDFNVIEMPFPRNIVGRWRLFKFIKAFFVSNFLLRKILKQQKPYYLLLPTEIAITYLFPTLCSSDAKIVFRCGDSPLTERKKGIFAKLYGICWKYVLVNRIDKLVCNAIFIQNQIHNSGRVKNLNDALIYNYPPKRLSINDGIVYRPIDGALRVGFMGRIVADKGVIELVKAVIECNKRGLKTVAYIGGNPSVDKEYTSSIKKILRANLEYFDCVQFVGNVKNIDAFYENIDVMAIPSVYPEPMANVLTEAKMHHCLSIIYNLGGMPELVEHKKNGYICNEVTSEALADSFAYYNQNRDEIIKQGEEAYRSISYLALDYEKFVKRWLAIFS